MASINTLGEVDEFGLHMLLWGEIGLIVSRIELIIEPRRL